MKGYDPSNPYALQTETTTSIAAEEQEQYSTIPQLEKAVAATKKSMEKAAKEMDFMEAARLRDLMFSMKEQLEKMKKSD